MYYLLLLVSFSVFIVSVSVLSGVKYAGISCCVEVTCAANEFRCASGTQCVDPYAQCNGVADCDDASDETVELCGKNLVAYPLQVLT